MLKICPFLSLRVVLKKFVLSCAQVLSLFGNTAVRNITGSHSFLESLKHAFVKTLVCI